MRRSSSADTLDLRPDVEALTVFAAPFDNGQGPQNWRAGRGRARRSDERSR